MRIILRGSIVRWFRRNIFSYELPRNEEIRMRLRILRLGY